METICTFAQGKFVCLQFDSGRLTHLNLLNSVKHPDEICVQCLLKICQIICRCKRKVPAKKNLRVHQAPNVMTMCLKRYLFML